MTGDWIEREFERARRRRESLPDSVRLVVTKASVSALAKLEECVEEKMVGRPQIADITKRRWWKGLYVVGDDGEKAVSPENDRDEHWYWSRRKDLSVSHKGKTRRLKPTLYDEFVGEHDSYVEALVPECGDDACMNPWHMRIESKGFMVQRAAGAARARRVEAAKPMRERRVRIHEVVPGEDAAGNIADRAYYAICSADGNVLRALRNDEQGIFEWMDVGVGKKPYARESELVLLEMLRELPDPVEVRIRANAPGESDEMARENVAAERERRAALASSAEPVGGTK